MIIILSVVAVSSVILVVAIILVCWGRRRRRRLAAAAAAKREGLVAVYYSGQRVRKAGDNVHASVQRSRLDSDYHEDDDIR